MDASERKFEVAETYKGWTILLASAYGIGQDNARYWVRVQSGGRSPIDVPTDDLRRQPMSEARAYALAYAHAFIDVLGVDGDDSLTIGFPLQSEYEHALGVHFPVIVNGAESRVLISVQCLGDHFGDAMDDQWQQIFETHREQVQAFVERLIRDGARGDLLISSEVWSA